MSSEVGAVAAEVVDLVVIRDRAERLLVGHAVGVGLATTLADPGVAVGAAPWRWLAVEGELSDLGTAFSSWGSR